MKPLVFSYKQSAGLSDTDIDAALQRCISEHKRMQSAWGAGYDSEYASLNLCADVDMVARVKSVAEQKLAYNPELIVVIGIGGSSLGTHAVCTAVNGALYNETTSGPRLYFVESIDSDYTASVLYLARQVLERNGNIIVTVVTKSGTTTETIANAHIFISLLQEFYQDSYNNYVVAITDSGSKLHEVARTEQIETLEIPFHVGGRYSVLSPVGLFPCALVGIDIDAVLRGACFVNERAFSNDVENHSMISAAIKYLHYVSNNINIEDMFLFSIDCSPLGQWYRQLMGESIGKMYNQQGKRVEVGITPTVSVGTIDLHSVGQLYLGGPRDKCITFVRVMQSDTDIKVPHVSGYSSLVSHITGKTCSTILNATFDGVVAAYATEHRPFMTLELPDTSEESLGQFLQMYMLEMMYLGYLLDVNPFDQPQVELYKKETRKILADE